MVVSVQYRDPDFVHKLVLLGDSGVGKTSLVERFVYDSLSTDMTRTIGAVLHVKRVELNDELHKLIIWDLGGQESFPEMREQYCANASGAFFVYDRSRPETFTSMDNWLSALESAVGNVPIVVVENKVDLESRMNDDEVHSEIAKRILKYVQTSATENIHVEMAFLQLVREIKEKRSVG